jgi:phenylpyruvate tautomerase PptA (4-oxalocrotonate tautomerase family)
MIDIYAAAGTFSDTSQLPEDLAATLMAVKGVPNIPMFGKNTAAFVHELPPSSFANVDGDSTYVRVQVLTNAGALDRDKQLAVVRQLTDLIAAAAGDSSLTERTWVLLTEAPEGRLGLAGPRPPQRGTGDRRSRRDREAPGLTKRLEGENEK